MKPAQIESSVHAIANRWYTHQWMSSFHCSFLGVVFLAACGAQVHRTATPQQASVGLDASGPRDQDANAETNAPDSAQGELSSPPPVPTASDRVRAMIDSIPSSPVADAEWFPFRILEIIARATGELPAPVAPTETEGRVVWSLVMSTMPHTRDANAYASSCDEVSRAEPRIVCAVDTIAVGPTDRVRLAFGWKQNAGNFAADLAIPLRVLSRLTTGLCLLSAERTEHTLELRLQSPDLRALGTSLALMSTAPRMSDAIMVEAEPAPGSTTGAIRVLLSWPTDRVDHTSADLGDDAWPARCDEHATIAHDVPARSTLTPILLVRGERARGAVVNVAHREWILTEGDLIADARVTAINDRGVYLQRGRGRPRLVRYATRSNVPTLRTLPAHPPRIPLPPEPPAPLP